MRSSIRIVSVGALAAIVMSCGGGSDQGTLDVSGLPAEATENWHPVRSDGSLDERVARVSEVTAEYDFGPEPMSVPELAERVDGVVVARATGRGQIEHGSGLVSTTQRFEVSERISGEVPSSFTVLFPGGLVSEDRSIVLLESPEEPQFRPDASYLLFLVDNGMENDEFWTFGPDAGRFLVEDGVVVGGVELDRHAANPPSDDAPIVASELAGQSLDELRATIGG